MNYYLVVDRADAILPIYHQAGSDIEAAWAFVDHFVEHLKQQGFQVEERETEWRAQNGQIDLRMSLQQRDFDLHALSPRQQYIQGWLQ